ncbi:DNA mismatch repair endonuclease MutL, partial [bacterium]|nr:DNA mismatch repair endonuclease MutL [bacterium]
MEIKVLPSEVVDQIAAGEVVERPSHLLKELIENALDAGATQIEVEADEGGKKIKVSDNGKGIHLKDLPLVCARHATSKISAADDLWKLRTFGFRGEALASISSVSRLKITSRQKNSEQAFALENNFGKEAGAPFPAGREPGTTVEVDELFSNVPARLKFLKSDSAEMTQIKSVVRAMALANPSVEFKLKQQGKMLLFYPSGQELLSRAQSVLEVKDVFVLQREFQGFELEIVYSSPEMTTGNSKQLWIFVQNRWVSDRTIQAAILESYRSLLMHGEYPFVVLKLHVPEDMVDVNIHPTKSQVKFTDSSQIFRFVHSSLRSELEKAPWIATLNQAPQPEIKKWTPPVQESNLSFSAPAFTKTQYQQKDFSMEALKNAATTLPAKEEVVFSSEPIREPELQFWSQLQVIGQSHLTYIVAEAENSFFLIDQHAAHERVVFERLMNAWKDGKFDVQNFLLPISVDMSAESVDQMVALQEEFRRFGVELEKAGPETLLICSSPSFISESGLIKAIQKFADEIVSLGGSFSFEKKIADIFATMSCHSVVRAG